MHLGSIVLAGGRSRRLGKPKESLPWGGSTLLHATVVTLLDCTFPVVVVARDQRQELPPLHTECELAFDGDAGGGPLVGIAAGLDHLAAACDAAFVIGCDQPFVTAETVSWLADHLGEADAVVIEDEARIHPLCAIYRVGTLALCRELLASGERSAKALPAAIGARPGGLAVVGPNELDRFDPAREFLRNINSIADYERARHRPGS